MRQFRGLESEVMDKIEEIFRNILTNIGTIPIIILFLITIWIFISDFTTACKMAKMVIDIYRSGKKEHIISHIGFLLKTNGDFLQRITDFEYIKTWQKEQVKEIIQKYTDKNEGDMLYGVVEQRKAQYYTDLQKACLDNNQQLDALAFSIALLITTELNIYGKNTSYAIVGQADGNVLLANRVATILGLKYFIIGNLAGKKDKIFGDYGQKDKVILVDDILFTGTLLTQNLNILHKNGLQCTHIVVILRRSLAYQEVLAKFINEKGYDILVKSIFTYLDNDFDSQFGKRLRQTERLGRTEEIE